MPEQLSSVEHVIPGQVVDPAPADMEKLTVYIIRPSRYDDDGYVIRHRMGVLPSNTLACLHGLTLDVDQRKALGDHIEIESVIIDETVQKLPVKTIVREASRKRSRVVVCLAGVQSNQFARATDLALRFAAKNVHVMIGGFHVSGTVAMFPEGSPELDLLMDAGVTLVAGEVEDRWGELLSDFMNDRLNRFYNYLDCPPELDFSPIPQMPRHYSKRFASDGLGTIDTSRGCPFNCSFCTIINVQGRKMRCRQAESMRETILQNREGGLHYYFLTDDNFSRNRNWRDIFEMLTELRNDESPIDFMMQVDVKAYKIPGFVELAAKAGCSQAFIGMESLNAENLAEAGKTQNDTTDYSHMVDVWHRHGIAVHVGFIIGFPHDTVASIKADVRTLAEEIKVDQASFFMLTPLPGSRDHKEAVEQGANIDKDLNQYDSFHPAMDHPTMSRQEWFGAYQDAWRDFYSLDNMKAILRRARPSRYWSIFKKFIWYKHSVVVENCHPMVTGFLRVKERLAVRPGMIPVGRFKHIRTRVREVIHENKLRMKFFWELQELWLQTRRRTENEELIADALHEITLGTRRARLRVADWKYAFSRAQQRVPSAFRIVMGKANVLSLKWTYTREDINAFWDATSEKLSRRAFHRINWLKASWYLLRDVTISTRFALSMFTERI
jgi:radical SAM superfamily enzyme YgiQ (UPF0313 family)